MSPVTLPSMKDIKDYFANGARATVESDDAAESRAKRDCDVEMDGCKRRRVKIRIMRTGSKERTCNMVESKNDLIDKTPSPLIKTNDREKIVQRRTFKSRCMERNLEKDFQSSIEINRDESGEAEKSISLSMPSKDETDKEKMDKQIILNLDDSYDDNTRSINVSVSNALFCDDIGSQREASNAFQVLMNRGKPIQYKSSQHFAENADCRDILDDAKKMRSKCKEKLTALTDKKDYSKRELMATREDERIKKRMENHIRHFKIFNNEQDDTTKSSMENNRQSSGNLFNYFSKSSLELTNKNTKYGSTFVVKADVHRTDVPDVEPVLKSVPNKIYFNNKSNHLSNMDDIHIIESENLVSPQVITKQNKRQQRKEKPRWSLRIKLYSSEDNDTHNDSTDDEFSPRSKSKFNTALNKSRKSVKMHLEKDSTIRLEEDGHAKIKMQNKEKSKLLSVQKNSNDEMNAIVQRSLEENADSENPNDSKKLDKVSEIKEKFNNTCETVITITDDSEYKINENVLKRKPNEKLAPLFMKRRKTDPIIAAARRLFLQSDIIDAGKNMDKKISNYSMSILPFPIISHITQLEDKSERIESKIRHRFQTKAEKKYSPLIDVSKYKSIIDCIETPRATQATDEPMKNNLEQALAEIEKRCPDVERMWKTISSIKSESEKKPLSRTRGRKTKSLEQKIAMLAQSVKSEEGRSYDCVWTCKYKPTNAQDVVGNEEAARKLKDWLSGWRPSLTKEDNSSGDEFYSSDYSHESYNHQNNQIAVLLGPHGSGKSASVYAIAEELNYSVLEVNASSRRTGKKILKELKEATKSHRIKKSKHKCQFKQVGSESELPKISQNSLILLEDIDLVFEEDDGFVSAAYQLALNTKRPIIMTCRDTCPHLSKIASQQNKIYFQKVNGDRVATLLELISLAETGHRLSQNCLMKLLQAGDLRKALLQLQYLLLSGPPILTEQSMSARSSLWQNMQWYLYKPAIKLNKKYKVKKNTNIKKLDKCRSDIASILNGLAGNLDSLSLVSSLVDIEDVTLIMSEANAQPSLSLTENLSLYSSSRYTNTDIANFINDKILHEDLYGNKHMRNQNRIILRKQLNQGVDLALSHITFACLDRRAMALDYLPTARAICRAEESRSIVNYKRSNRFFHYLHSLKVPTALMKPNILAAACRTLQERADKNISASSALSVTIN